MNQILPTTSSRLPCLFVASAVLAAALCEEPAVHPVMAGEPVQVSDEYGVWTTVVADRVVPFWRKGDGPTYAPHWFAAIGPVTHEVRTPEELLQAVPSLKPGDHLQLQGGTYELRPTLTISCQGTAEQPIAIRAAPGAEVILTRANAEKNVIDIVGAQYLLLAGVHIRGGSNGIKFYEADHVMLYELNVGNTDGSAITANAAETSFLSIVDCEIHHAGGHGEGLYLGGHNGVNITKHTRVVGNYIHDMVGPRVSQGDGIEVKHGSYDVIVRYNFVQDTNYPGIIAYGADPQGQQRNIIEANVVIDSRDAAMQIGADAVVRNNLIINRYSQGRTFLSKREERVAPRNLTITHNTFIANGRVATFSNWSGAAASDIVFANNALFSESQTYLIGAVNGPTFTANYRVESLDWFTELDPEHELWNAVPKADSRLRGWGNPMYTLEDDLLGRKRSAESVDVGAFAAEQP